MLVIPAVIALLWAIKRYYRNLEARVNAAEPLRVDKLARPIMLVAIEDWNELAERALVLALSLSEQVVGIHLTQLSGPEESFDRGLRERWERNVAAPARAGGLLEPELVIVPASYRAIHQPMLRIAREIELRFPDRFIAVMVPELVKQHWYQNLLHTHRAGRLRRKLLQHGGARLTVINVPWRLEERPLPELAP